MRGAWSVATPHSTHLAIFWLQLYPPEQCDNCSNGWLICLNISAVIFTKRLYMLRDSWGLFRFIRWPLSSYRCRSADNVFKDRSAEVLLFPIVLTSSFCFTFLWYTFFTFRRTCNEVIKGKRNCWFISYMKRLYSDFVYHLWMQQPLLIFAASVHGWWMHSMGAYCSAEWCV